MTLTIIPVGFFDSDVAVLSPDQEAGQERIKIPIYAYLLRTPDTLILFDTGCSHQCRTDPIGLLGNDTVRSLTPLLTPDDHISAQLQRLSLQTRDIDLVVNSHCHFDHAGGNHTFPTHQFAMQRAEYEAATSDSDTYPDLAFKPVLPASLTLLQGDTELAPGATLLSTPGHTLGHQSLLVELHDQAVLITSDAVYTRHHFSLDHVGASKDLTLARTSLQRLLQVAKDGARPFFSHDPQQISSEGWKLAPYTYA